MIINTLAALGAVLVASICRALWIGLRTARGSRLPPEEWLVRNGFVYRDDGRWHRSRLTVKPGRHGWAVEYFGAMIGLKAHPCNAVHVALTTELKWMRSVRDGLR